MDILKLKMMLLLLLVTAGGCASQTLRFDAGVSYDRECGLTPSGNWSASGSLTLSDQDLIVFKQKIIIQAVMEVCTVDLTACSPTDLPVPRDACHCRSRSGDQYEVHVGAKPSLTQNGMSVQAVIPSRDLFQSIASVTHIGKLPPISENPPRTKANFRVDNGVQKVLKDTQHIAVCPNRYVALDICVENSGGDSRLRVTTDDHTSLTTVGPCVHSRHNFTSHGSPSGSTHTVKFEYTDRKGCTHDASVIHFEEDEAVCESCPQSPRERTTLADGTPALVDNTADGGHWVIFQRRISGITDFYRNWTDYTSGFGNLTDNFWIGLGHLHQLCNEESPCEMRIDLKYDGNPSDTKLWTSGDGCYYAKYEHFSIAGEDEYFRLNISGYSGNAGDALTSRHNNMYFSTADNDHDTYEKGNCAARFTGAWWYTYCHDSNLNGKWGGSEDAGVRWKPLSGRGSVQFSEMKIRQHN